jgi:predicted nuclease with TOPRIM domain
MSSKPPPIGVLSFPVRAHATRNWKPRDILELPLTKNQQLKIVEVKSEHWYIARTTELDQGWVPAAMIKLHATIDSMDITGLYKDWKQKLDIAFGDKQAFDENGNEKTRQKMSEKSFPWLSPEVTACEEMSCMLRKNEKRLGACVHDVEKLLHGAGEVYCAKWLWKEKLKWHPDRFAKKCAKSWKKEGMEVASEMFIVLGELIDKVREAEKKSEEESGVRL